MSQHELVQSINRESTLPTLSLATIWDIVGDQGVHSESPTHFASCFDVLFHKDGILYYRMKFKKDRRQVTMTGNPLFKGVVFHDPMELFIPRSSDDDRVHYMATHYSREEGIEVAEALENDSSLTYEEFVERFGKEFE
jgi:hypothetical protein